MPSHAAAALICHSYQKAFDARIAPAFAEIASRSTGDLPVAALGYQRASVGPLFLECYLDRPIEEMIAHFTGNTPDRFQIIEIGNLASSNALAMIELWGAVANDLAGDGEIAVATLTAPLRAMFARIGVPIHVLARAHSQAPGIDPDAWGRYYEADPMVCFGRIAEGQHAIARLLSRRSGRAAA